MGEEKIKLEHDNPIGKIWNYYGQLHCVENEGKFYWSIECMVSEYWEEIPKYLYDALIKFKEENPPTNSKEGI